MYAGDCNMQDSRHFVVGGHLGDIWSRMTKRKKEENEGRGHWLKMQKKERERDVGEGISSSSPWG